jgi:V/A-type H+/Na+-transporting ATPase subunit E
MRSVDENIEALSRAMLSDAQAEANQTLVEARAKADAILQSAQQQAARVREGILERARVEAERIHSQVLATAQMKARTVELEHREKLLEQVLQTSCDQLPSVQKWTEYQRIAADLVYEAATQLKSKDLIVRADPHTQSLLTDQVLAELSKKLDLKLTLGTPLEQGTGVVVETADGHLQFDNTLETRLNRLRNTLRSPIYRILVGETL